MRVMEGEVLVVDCRREARRSCAVVAAEVEVMLKSRMKSRHDNEIERLHLLRRPKRTAFCKLLVQEELLTWRQESRDMYFAERHRT
jgi:hypothetical protein